MNVAGIAVHCRRLSGLCMRFEMKIDEALEKRLSIDGDLSRLMTDMRSDLAPMASELNDMIGVITSGNFDRGWQEGFDKGIEEGMQAGIAAAEDAARDLARLGLLIQV
jgi:hypothetical protein